MDLDRKRPRGGAALLLGPGAPQELRSYLQVEPSCREISELADLADILQLRGEEVLLDGSMIPSEDVGIIKRALEQNGVTLTVLGGDPNGGSVRQILKLQGSRWLPNPPDTDDLALLRSRPPSKPTRAEPRPSPVTPEQSTTTVDPALAEIEAILSQPTGGLDRAMSDPSTEAEEGSQGDGVEQRGESSGQSPPQALMQSHAPVSTSGTEAPWFKDQVADLADLVQVIYASTAAGQDDVEGKIAASLYTDALRLVQFTRTLGYLAAPPARGNTEMDICELAEELLRSAGAAADAPRFLLRAAEPLSVRADKELLIQAMDAILVLSKLCAGPDGTVKLSGERNEEGWVSLELSFPGGPISGLSPEEIVVPYALRSALPDMGRNALRAAARIITGQGGALELSAGPEGSLQFNLTLPPA